MLNAQSLQRLSRLPVHTMNATFFFNHLFYTTKSLVNRIPCLNLLKFNYLY
jgi:hypothetical protein